MAIWSGIGKNETEKKFAREKMSLCYIYSVST
jgi:hypothetical protein